MAFKAVLFDMDGTLIDTLEDIGNSANRVLSAKNLPIYSMDEYRYFVGKGAAWLIKCVLPEEMRKEDTIQEFLEAFVADYGKNLKVKSRLYPGIAEMLNALRKQGLKMTILSNKPHDMTMQFADDMLSEWNFEVVFGQRENIPKKPDPVGAMEIANRLNVLPEDFLYVGDTGIDMETATRAGMYAVGVLWGFRQKEELLKTGARTLLETPMDILELLE